MEEESLRRGRRLPWPGSLLGWVRLLCPQSLLTTNGWLEGGGGGGGGGLLVGRMTLSGALKYGCPWILESPAAQVHLSLRHCSEISLQQHSPV